MDRNLFTEIADEMDAADGTYLHLFLLKEYKTAMRFCYCPIKQIKFIMFDWFGIYADEFAFPTTKKLSDAEEHISVALNALYAGRIVCATVHLLKALNLERKEKDSFIINQFTKKINMLVEAGKFTLNSTSDWEEMIMDELFSAPIHTGGRNKELAKLLRETIELKNREELRNVVLDHLTDKPQDVSEEPQPIPEEDKPTVMGNGTMIDSGRVDKPDAPTSIPDTPNSDMIGSRTLQILSNVKREDWLPDTDAFAKFHIMHGNIIHWQDAEKGFYWLVFDGIVNVKTKEKFSIFNVGPSYNIPFFKAVKEIYRGVLLDRNNLDGWKVKLNTFISALRANYPYFQTRDIDYIPTCTDRKPDDVVKELCERIRHSRFFCDVYNSHHLDVKEDPYEDLNRVFALICRLKK